MQLGTAGAGASRLLDGAPPPHRLKYEYVVVLTVQPATGGVLSRFVADTDRKFREGREKAEEVIGALRAAGLSLKVRKHQAKDGSKLVLAFVGASSARLELQSRRLGIERWLQEEGIGGSMGALHGSGGVRCGGGGGTSGGMGGGMGGGGGGGGFLSSSQQQRPTMQVVKVGGLHYFAPVEAGGAAGDAGGGAAGAGAGGAGNAGAGNAGNAGAGTGSSSTSAQPSSSAQPPSPSSATAAAPYAPTAAQRLELLEHILYSSSSQGGCAAKLFFNLRTPSHAFARLLTPSHAFSCLRTPSHAPFHATSSHAVSRPPSGVASRSLASSRSCAAPSLTSSRYMIIDSTAGCDAR